MSFGCAYEFSFLTDRLRERVCRGAVDTICEALIRCADEETCIIRVHQELLRFGNCDALEYRVNIELARRLSHLRPGEVL